MISFLVPFIGAVSIASLQGISLKSGKTSDYALVAMKKVEGLVGIFQDCIDTVSKVNTTFSSLAVSVNTFNYSTHLDDLYFTLFNPHATNNAWLDNLKKYKRKFDSNNVPFIADQTGADAMSADFRFFIRVRKATGQQQLIIFRLRRVVLRANGLIPVRLIYDRVFG